MSDLANEEDEAFSDAVSQIEPTTVTSIHLWVFNYKSEVKLNVLCTACTFSFSSTAIVLFAFVCASDYKCMYVCTFRIRGLSICSFAIYALRGASYASIRSLSLSLFRPLHTILLTDFQLEFTIWAAINRSLPLSSWIVILRWRWQCFAFEFPKHNYVCSWKMRITRLLLLPLHHHCCHHCCRCHYFYCCRCCYCYYYYCL